MDTPLVSISCLVYNHEPFLRECFAVSKAEKLGWKYRTELKDGIRLAYEDFLNNPMRAER